MSEQQDYDGIKYREEDDTPTAFKILFVILVFLGAVFMGYYLFSGWSSQTEADEKINVRIKQKLGADKAVKESGPAAVGTGVKPGADVAAGKKLFGNLCAACHGESAKGGVGPDLTVSKYKYGKSRSDIIKTVTEGRPGGMPSFSSQIDKAQIESLVEFVLTLK